MNFLGYSQMPLRNMHIRCLRGSSNRKSFYLMLQKTFCLGWVKAAGSSVGGRKTFEMAESPSISWLSLCISTVDYTTEPQLEAIYNMHFIKKDCIAPLVCPLTCAFKTEASQQIWSLYKALKSEKPCSVSSAALLSHRVRSKQGSSCRETLLV